MAFEDHLLDLGGSGIELRSAGSDDGDLIRRIVAMTTNWRLDDVPAAVELAEAVDKYHEGWGRPGDIGVLCFSGIAFAGGAYVRHFRAADGNYGYVADDIPELAIAVEPSYRRRGLGVLLLAALKAKVLEQGFAGISLSVEPDNDSRFLYMKMGFVLVEDRGHDLLMVWRRPGEESS